MFDNMRAFLETMRAEYEITEQDFYAAQQLAIRHSPQRFIRWTRWVLPGCGVALLVFLVSVLIRIGFSVRLIPGLAICSLFIFLPLLNRRSQKSLYARTPGLHGRRSVEADDDGLEFSGTSFTSQVAWDNFTSFLEDEKSFLLYQNPQVFNIIPKRTLSADQIARLRAYLDQKIGHGKLS
jgi:hypothetical protein